MFSAFFCDVMKNYSVITEKQERTRNKCVKDSPTQLCKNVFFCYTNELYSRPMLFSILRIININFHNYCYYVRSFKVREK